MNDLDFARLVSARIGQLYAEAKRSAHRFPRNTLIAVRSLASLCCDLLGGHAADWPDGLDDKIRALDRAHLINPGTREQLALLRKWGNRAAHPEDGLLDHEDQQELATRALGAAIALLETVFQQKTGGAALPAYEVVDDALDELREACYRALMENSAADQHQVAMFLRQQLDARIEEAKADPDSGLRMYGAQFEFRAQEERLLDMLRYASDAGHTPARYRYGLALAEGRLGQEKVMYGANLIAMACRDGDIDAIAWCGRAAMYGLLEEPVDYERARGLLERAAAEDHPMALTLLSLIHRDGLGVEADAGRAFALTLRAADAGYALAQYEAAVALFFGRGVAVDEAEGYLWLKQASDAGLPAAQYALARGMLERRFPGAAGEVERLLVAASQRINGAHLALAELYMAQEDQRNWLEAAGRIQACFETALNEKDAELAQRCREAAPGIIARLEAMIRSMPDKLAESVLLTRFLFDEKGRPYPNRAARMQRMVDATRQLAQVRGTGSSEELRLMRELGSNMGGAKAPLTSAPRPGAALPVVRREAPLRIGRNEPCPCSSGRKFKQCCAVAPRVGLAAGGGRPA